jgi:hypothetical protein
MATASSQAAGTLAADAADDAGAAAAAPAASGGDSSSSTHSRKRSSATKDGEPTQSKSKRAKPVETIENHFNVVITLKSVDESGQLQQSVRKESFPTAKAAARWAYDTVDEANGESLFSDWSVLHPKYGQQNAYNAMARSEDVDDMGDEFAVVASRWLSSGGRGFAKLREVVLTLTGDDFGGKPTTSEVNISHV